MSAETSGSRKRWRRRLLVAAGVVVIGAAVLWLSSGAVIAALLERQLRGAGFAGAEVAGVGLTTRGVAIRRISLVADALELEGVRARFGSGGIAQLAVERLHLRAELRADGELVLPFPAAGADGGGAGEALALVPPEGIAVDAIEVALTSTAGVADARAAFSAVRVERRGDAAHAEGGFVLTHALGRLEGMASAELAGDGALGARLDVADGGVAAGNVSAAQLSGEIVAALPAQGAPVVDVALDAAAATLGEHAAGTLAVTAAWRGEMVDFTLEARGPLLAQAAVMGRAELRDGLRSLEVTGQARLERDDAQGDVSLEARLSDADGDGELTGDVELEARELTAPAWFSRANVQITAVAAGNRQRLRLTGTTAPWTAALRPAAAALPASLQAFAGEPLAVTLTPATQPERDRTLELLVDFTQRSARLDASFAASAGQALLNASGTFTAQWQNGIALSADPLAISAATLPLGDVTVLVNDFAGAASYDPQRWHLRGAGTLLGSGTLGALRFDGLRARWSGAIAGGGVGVGAGAGAGETLSVTADRCIEWRVAALEWDEWRVKDLAPPCLAPRANAALATLRRDAGRAEDGSALELALATSAAPLSVELTRAGEPHAIRGTWPALQLSATLGDDGFTSLDATLTGGALTLMDANVAIAGVNGALAMQSGAITTATLTAGAIESRADPPLFPPLELEASVARAAGADADAGLALEALLSDDLGIVVLEAMGRMRDGRGSADLKLYPLTLVPGATQIADLSPALGERVTNASGTLELTGALEWDDDGLQSRATVTLKDAGATVAELPIAGVDAVLELASLLPPVSAPRQVLRIASIDVGVPLTNGTVVYGLDADGRIAIDELAFDLAGGRVSTEPFIVDSGASDDIRFVLHAERVDLSQLLALSRIDGLQGTGALSGRVPVRISARGLQLDDGVLEAQTDGVLRYTPGEPPAFLRGDDMRSTMLREVLTNFQYDELALTIASDSEESNEQTVRLSAKGANPDFLEGHPIELNFNFSGPLLGAMRSAVDLAGAEAVQNLFEQQQETEAESAR